ncbi:BgTH12-03365 [Blumeria graminis f. sp. triticale]|uniref:BgTH12-03365 n=1 Tax=Blumeria graminis f. sp. triticale TaxID=1689686 RepID=A0A9W4GFL6_BLUGR|nr:BgTH12-03365 [Blumeria graminis f. sp. triticale]
MRLAYFLRGKLLKSAQMPVNKINKIPRHKRKKG